MASRMEQLLGALANGGTVDFVPRTRNEALLKKIMENGGTGGGGNTGGGGATSWEDLGSTFEEGTVLAECNPAFNEDEGTFYTVDSISVITGKEYTVNWNGVPYKCIAQEFIDGEIVMTSLGDAGALEGTQTTGEPFFILVAPPEIAAVVGYTSLILAIDGSTSVTLSITGPVETITPVPEKYLPEEAGQYVVNITNFTTLPNTDQIVGYPDKTFNEVLRCLKKGKLTVVACINTSESYVFYRCSQYNDEGISFCTISYDSNRINFEEFYWRKELDYLSREAKLLEVTS